MELYIHLAKQIITFINISFFNIYKIIFICSQNVSKEDEVKMF